MDNNKQIESQVMAKIKSGQVKLRSKYIFLAEKLGIGSAFILSVLLAVLFFSLVLFYLQASDNLYYLSFGSIGLFAFLESFPYLLIVTLILFIFVAGVIIKKSDISYQKPFGYLAIGLVAFILLAGIGLALTDIAETLHRGSANFPPMERMFSPFGEGSTREGNRGVAGRITEIGADYILIQTPQHFLKLNVKDNLATTFEVGQFVVAVGKKVNNGFDVEQLRTVDEAQMPMIRNDIHERFGPLNEEVIKRGKMRKSCFDDCPKLRLSPKDCGDKCFGSSSSTIAPTK